MTIGKCHTSIATMLIRTSNTTIWNITHWFHHLISFLILDPKINILKGWSLFGNRLLLGSHGPRTRSRTQNLALIWCQTEHKSAALPIELYGDMVPWSCIRCHYSLFLFLITTTQIATFFPSYNSCGQGWGGRGDSNSRSPEPQSGALTN